MSEPVGRLERYDVKSRLAVGGMAEVYLATARGAHGFEKTVALKRILPQLAQEPQFERRFIGEAKLAAKLSHANIVQVLDFGRYGGSWFIAMEFVDGLDLAHLLRQTRQRGEPLPLPAAFHIAIELLRGLEYAHQLGVVHRDVSPSNILLSRAGEVKIADFGIAIVSRRERVGAHERVIAGKWRYMSPEQTRGDELDARSDVFSAAIVLFELFTGARLFSGNNNEEVAHQVCDMPIPAASSLRPELPAELDAILEQALARDRGVRTPRAGLMQRALTELSYRHNIVASADDVAHEVAAALKARAPAPSLDALIREQLAAIGVEASTHGSTRRTELASIDSPGEAPVSGSASSTDEPLDATGFSLVHELGADGIASLWPQDAASAAPASPPPLAGVSGADAEPVHEPTVAAVPRARRASQALALEEDAAGEQAGAPAANRHVGSAESAAETVASSSPAIRSVRTRRRGTFAAALGLAVVASIITVWQVSVRSRPRLLPTAEAARTATLVVESEPSGAWVSIDGRRVGQTPLYTTLAASSGSRVEVSRDGFEPYTDARVVLATATTTRIRATLRPRTARLTVETDPPGAMVWLDGVSLGPTPIQAREVAPAASARLEVARTGFQRETREVTLAAGNTAALRIALRPGPAGSPGTPGAQGAIASGFISVQIDDSWGEVFLRGSNRSLGEVPNKRLAVPLGRHQLLIRNPKTGQETTLAVEVVADKVNYYRTRY